MKLIHYTIYKLLLPLLIILAVWSCLFYFLILYEINDETNDSLRNYKELIIKQVLSDTTLLTNRPDIMTRYYIREISEKEADLGKDIYFDSTQYIEIEMEYEPIRVLQTHFMSSDGKYYELRIETSTLEKEDLIETILFSIVILYLILIICILLVTRYAFKKSFRPLYAILDWLKSIRPDRPGKPLINETIVEEFSVLNNAITEANRRSLSLYEQQKQFVENASHELQTPLAVCMNKLELFSENPDCTEEQLSEIAGIYQTLKGIVRTNRSLLLLSRIDNKQFFETNSVSINGIAEKIIREYTEIYENKHIRISCVEKEELKYMMNESLAIILIKNLVKNAFVHNMENGYICITFTHNTFTIENSSKNTELDKEKMFLRFNKQTGNKHSTGLGLSIVKSITSLYGIRITYKYNEKHVFTLTFK